MCVGLQSLQSVKPQTFYSTRPCGHQMCFVLWKRTGDIRFVRHFTESAVWSDSSPNAKYALVHSGSVPQYSRVQCVVLWRRYVAVAITAILHVPRAIVCFSADPISWQNSSKLPVRFGSVCVFVWGKYSHQKFCF